MKAEGVPAVIVKFVNAISPDVFAEPKFGANTILGLLNPNNQGSSTPESSLKTIDSIKKSSVLLPYPLVVPSFCTIALMRSTSVHLAEALCSMTCRPHNRAPMIR